ncbi:MAG: hypothetical protein FJY86_00745 [Candidatus Diapherotrites archaeon]|uniref:Uncharacterized protein n=1 Tax=Candidatus Iainarchaeum sp. TaxID=3101447 RepID=A0A8T4C5U3_9ARCH|nr:hypothetical protein [Candidatus Diapherotrites archaeon]
MRPPEKRWYAPLLKNPQGTSVFIHSLLPTAKYVFEKIEKRPGKIIRYIRFDVDGHTILRGRSEIDLTKTNPKLGELLSTTHQPLAPLLEKYRVHRTRVRSTTRTREFHFVGELHAKLFERFYSLPPKQKKR